MSKFLYESKANKRTIWDRPHIIIDIDEDPIDPRMDDGNICLLCIDNHRQYDFPNETGISVDEIQDSKLYKNAPFKWPVYMYEHGNVAFSLSDFHDPFDSGLLGFAICTDKTLESALGKDWRENYTEADIRKQVEAELKTYQKYVNGDSYWWGLKDENDDCLESVGGYYDLEEAVEDAIETIKAYADKETNEVRKGYFEDIVEYLKSKL